MNVYVSQIYIQVGVNFPFTHLFQKFMLREISELVAPSEHFVRKYGPEFNLIFRMSAKTQIQDNEIRGPSVYRKTTDVEYTIFLPFDAIVQGGNVEVDDNDALRIALRFLFEGMVSVFDSLGIDSGRVREKQDSLIEVICSEPSMFR